MGRGSAVTDRKGRSIYHARRIDPAVIPSCNAPRPTARHGPGPPGQDARTAAGTAASVSGPTATSTSASLPTGFPFPVGAANIYRVPAAGGTPEVFASGFTHIVDLTFGPDGSLYVLEIAKNGLLAAFTANDSRRAHPHRARRHQDRTRAGILTAPGGVAVGSDGALDVTNNSIFSDIGEVIRIRP